MTISKKLYLNFGAILALVLVLFIANIMAVQREHAARAATVKAMAMAQQGESARFQMMQNRLSLRNYLLSGDTRELDKMNEGIARLNELLKDLNAKASSELQRSSFAHLADSERQWETGFARPLADKRKQVDAGNATVADLQ